MSKMIDVAAVCGMVMERGEEDPREALRQFAEAAEQLKGTGVDLVVTPFCDQIAEHDGRGEAYDPVSYGISILHELSYRNFSTMVGLGRYLHHHDGLARNKILYQLVTVKYYFPQLADMYTGIVLKAHKFKAAESIQVCIGKRF